MQDTMSDIAQGAKVAALTAPVPVAGYRCPDAIIESEVEFQVDASMDITMSNTAEGIPVDTRNPLVPHRQPLEVREGEIESQVAISSDATEAKAATNPAKVVVVFGGDGSPDPKQPSDPTPVKSAKKPSWLNTKPRKVAAVVVVVLIILGVVGGVVAGLMSADGGSPTLTLTPVQETVAPAPVPKANPPQVSTITSGSFMFNSLFGVAVSSTGYIYLSDEHRILRLMEGGNVDVYAGGTSSGSDDGSKYTATFYQPRTMAMSSCGDLYICDLGNGAIRKISGDDVSTVWMDASTDLYGVAVEPGGFVYVTTTRNTVVQITSAGTASTWATLGSAPMGVAVDSAGTLYITQGHAVKKITTDGSVAVLAGSSESGVIDGIGEAARFDTPVALALGSDGNLYIADTYNHCIRKLMLTTKAVTTHAGVCGVEGSADGKGTSAQFAYPRGIAATSTGSMLYVTDGELTAGRLRKIYVSS